jgi:putative molybdopterin biosynthesis protein
MTASSGAPSPRAAYTQWVAACSDAGWRAGPVAEQVPVQAALGRVTAGAIRARWPSPRFACAAMDGIAVAASDAKPADRGGDVVLSASAFTWVDTGDLLPAGMDTVVERERVAELRADGSAVVGGALVRGKNVRAAGEDFQAGQLLVPAGRRLRPADLGAAAAAGYAAVAVARQPVVAIIPSGDEIRPVGAVLGPGEYTDSNSVMLSALAVRAGAVPAVTSVQPDDPDVLAAAAREAGAPPTSCWCWPTRAAGSPRGRSLPSGSRGSRWPPR